MILDYCMKDATEWLNDISKAKVLMPTFSSIWPSVDTAFCPLGVLYESTVHAGQSAAVGHMWLTQRRIASVHGYSLLVFVLCL